MACSYYFSLAEACVVSSIRSALRQHTSVAAQFVVHSHFLVRASSFAPFEYALDQYCAQESFWNHYLDHFGRQCASGTCLRQWWPLQGCFHASEAMMFPRWCDLQPYFLDPYLFRRCPSLSDFSATWTRQIHFFHWAPDRVQRKDQEGSSRVATPMKSPGSWWRPPGSACPADSHSNLYFFHSKADRLRHLRSYPWTEPSSNSCCQGLQDRAPRSFSGQQNATCQFLSKTQCLNICWISVDDHCRSTACPSNCCV